MELGLFAVGVKFFVESLRLVGARTIVLFDGGAELIASVGNRIDPVGERGDGAQFTDEGSAVLSRRGDHPFVEQAIKRRPGEFRRLCGEESAVSEDKDAAQRQDEDESGPWSATRGSSVGFLLRLRATGILFIIFVFRLVVFRRLLVLIFIGNPVIRIVAYRCVIVGRIVFSGVLSQVKSASRNVVKGVYKPILFHNQESLLC